MKAADGIARTGKQNRAYYQPGMPIAESPVCVYGSMAREVTGYSADYAKLKVTVNLDLCAQAAKLLHEHLRHPSYKGTFSEGDIFDDITEWNDKMSKQDVVRSMKEAASMADIGEDEDTKIIEFEPLPESTPAPAPKPEPVPA